MLSEAAAWPSHAAGQPSSAAAKRPRARFSHGSARNKYLLISGHRTTLGDRGSIHALKIGLALDAAKCWLAPWRASRHLRATRGCRSLSLVAFWAAGRPRCCSTSCATSRASSELAQLRTGVYLGVFTSAYQALRARTQLLCSCRPAAAPPRPHAAPAARHPTTRSSTHSKQLHAS